MFSFVRKFLLVFIIVDILVCVGGIWWVNNQLNTPRSHIYANNVIEVPDGSTTDQTLNLLAEKGILGEVLPLKLYIRYKHATPFIKAGYYKFDSPITPLAVLHKLEAGNQGSNKLTIIEGWTKWDIANAMAAYRPFRLNSKQALALLNDPRPIKDLDPTARSLEGYIFPDTYFFGSSTSAKEFLSQTTNRFREIWKKEIADAARWQRLSCHDAVTMASIIETEGKLAQERPIIASVIYNRLRKNMPLAMDSTIVYASKLAGAWKGNGIVYLSDVNRKSPYNTRIYAGLPPGPVGCPGLASLQAAVKPANSNYIYYVREPKRNDGAHNFYTNAADFELGVQSLRRWEARRGTK